MYKYYVIHNVHGKKTIEASNTYQACKKFAEYFGLRSTSGVNAYLLTKTHVADF